MLQDIQRSVDAITCLLPGAPATSTVALSKKNRHRPVNFLDNDVSKLRVTARQELQRRLLCGEGLFANLTAPEPAADELDDTAMAGLNLGNNGAAPPCFIKSPPVTNWLNSDDSDYVQAALALVDPDDREAFSTYMRTMYLGIAIITAGAGFGKTFLAALATLLGHAKEGNVFASAPTHSALDMFAEKLDDLDKQIVADCNKGLSREDPARHRRKLIVRAYKPTHEEKAFFNLLKFKDLDDADSASGNGNWDSSSHWKRQLSTAQYLLMAFGSDRAGRSLRPDDHEYLYELRTWFDKVTRATWPGWYNIRRVIRREITWEEYESFDKEYKLSSKDLMQKMSLVWDHADILCVIPSASHTVPEFKEWKQHRAQAFAIDEGAMMSKADLYTVWGNCLMPLLIAGDPKQLPPTVVSEHDKDRNGMPYNRFVADAKVSAQQYLENQGISVFQLKTQRRMVNGLFDAISKIMYREVPLKYGKGQEPSQEKFKFGRYLEDFMVNSRGMTASPEGKLLPGFIHCPDAMVDTDPATGSKRSPEQCQITLDFILEFFNWVQKFGILDPYKELAPSIKILTPYKSNVQEFEKLFWGSLKYKRLGRCLPKPTTSDSFQGHEQDIAVVVMGTRAVNPGPGFTSAAQRLNVMLTRGRSGMVVIGDLNVAGHLQGKTSRRVTKPGEYWVHKSGKGEKARVKKDGKSLYMFCQIAMTTGRWALVEGEKKQSTGEKRKGEPSGQSSGKGKKKQK